MDLTPFEAGGWFDPTAADAADLVAMLEYLAGLGVSTDELLAAFEGDYIHSAGLRSVFEEGPHSARDLAERYEVPVEQVLEIYRLLGIHLSGPDERRLLSAEYEHFGVLLGAATSFEGGEADEILRTASAALTSVAEAIVSVFVGGPEARVIDTHMGWLERAQLSQFSGQVGIEFGHLLGTLFRHHLKESIERQRQSMDPTLSRELRRMTIGFVDLVGYTSRSARMTPEELVGFVSDFVSRSYDVSTDRGGRLVKTIGDEVMISALDVPTGVDIVTALIEEFRVGDTAPRGGLANGEVVARVGDFFGPVVNLASRLAEEAVPGEVLAAAEVAGHVGPAFRCEPAGRRMLKGFAAPVPTVSISRA